jgi:hypothetical protein
LFHPLSLIIPALVLTPNLIYAIKPPFNVPSDRPKEPVVLVILERLGLAGCLITPVFYSIYSAGTFEIFVVVGMGLMLAIYYYCWLRYFRHDRNYIYLFSPLFIIPVPLAISPVVYFMLSSIILHSLPLFLASLVLASGHIPVSLISYRNTKAL